MRERVEQLVGGVSRLMWVMTFHSACARILRADAERLGYKRAFTIYDEADSLRMVKRCMEELDVDPKRFPPRAVRAQISAAKNQLLDAEEYGGGPGLLLRGDRRRRLPAVRAADARGQRDGLRRPAGAHRQPAGAVRGRPRALPPRLPLGARRRVPGHQPGPVPAAAAARRGARQPVRGRRRYQSIYGFRHADIRNILEFERDFPDDDGGQAGAELPLHPDDPRRRQRGHRQQPRPEAQAPVDRRGPRRAGDDRRARRRARRGALRGLGGRAAGGGRGRAARRDRGLLPGQRAEPGARGHAGALRDPLPGDRGHEVLRAGRDQGRDRLPEPDREPRRRGLVRADRQLAAARDRPDDPGAAALARQHHRAGHLGGVLRAASRRPAWARRR